MEQGLSSLKDCGLLAYITPNAWMTNYYGVQLRRHIFNQASFLKIVDLEPTKVFQNAVVDTTITVLKKDISTKNKVVTQIWQGTKDYQIVYRFDMNQSSWESDEEGVINLHANPMELSILTRLEYCNKTLADLVEYSQGVIPYKTKADGEANLYINREKSSDEWLPLIESASQVRRYEVNKPNAFVKYGPWLWCARDPRFFSEPKILFHRVRKKLPQQLVGGLDETGVINRHSLSNLILRPGIPSEILLAVLGLFNSKLANWWFVKRYGMLMEVGGFKVGKMPLPMGWDKGYSSLIVLSQRMFSLHNQVNTSKTSQEKTILQRQIEATDRQIDRLVYELYELTNEEIRIVEEGTK